MNLTSLLAVHAGDRAQHTALVHGAEAWTYAELFGRVRRVSGLLKSRGVGVGSRVLVFVPMSLELYAVVLGVMHCGAICVFIDPGMGRKRIDSAVELADPDVFVGVGRAFMLRLVSGPLRRIPIAIKVGGTRLDSLLHSAPEASEPAAVSGDDGALLTFTSGSTGAPKGALRTHQFLLDQHVALTDALGTHEDDVELQALPIFVLNTLAVGGTAVIAPVGRRVADVDPVRLCNGMLKRNITTAAASPALFRPLADYCRERRVTLPAVRRLYLGGAPVPPGLLADLAPLIPNGDTMVVYGSTEAEPISHILGQKVLAETAGSTARGEGLCVGEPVSSVRVRLEDEEILVAGRHVNPTYYKSEDAVARFKVRDPDGTIWHRTGDVGRFDDAGRLWLLGRYEHLVERAGRRIYPFALEQAARSVPGVSQAGLVQVAGKVILAVEGEGELVRSMEPFHPDIDEVRVLRRIPTDARHNAKVDYPALKKRLAGR